ncbi:MAG: hypothetical protein JOZ32_15235 [Bryobacterales bacterium]|nr:hypothetical protein [Bryobacterales bacterium]
MALPSLSGGGEPTRIVSSLLDTLVGTLGVAFALVRLEDPENGPLIEMLRVSEPLEGSISALEIGDALQASFEMAH